MDLHKSIAIVLFQCVKFNLFSVALSVWLCWGEKKAKICLIELLKWWCWLSKWATRHIMGKSRGTIGYWFAWMTEKLFFLKELTFEDRFLSRKKLTRSTTFFIPKIAGANDCICHPTVAQCISFLVNWNKLIYNNSVLNTYNFLCYARADLLLCMVGKQIIQQVTRLRKIADFPFDYIKIQFWFIPNWAETFKCLVIEP